MSNYRQNWSKTTNGKRQSGVDDESTIGKRESVDDDESVEDPTVNNSLLDVEFNQASTEADQRYRRERIRCSQLRRPHSKRQSVTSKHISVEPINATCNEQSAADTTGGQHINATGFSKCYMLVFLLVLLLAAVTLNAQIRNRVDVVVSGVGYAWRALLVALFQIAHSVSVVVLEAYSLSTALSCDMAYYMCVHHHQHCDHRCNFLS